MPVQIRTDTREDAVTSLHQPRMRRRRLGVAAAAFGLVASFLAAGPAAAIPDPGGTPAKERVMTEVAPPILAELTTLLRELDKSGEREAAKDQGAVKLAEVTPAAPPVPVPAQAVRKTEPRQAESRPVETRHAEMARPVEVRPVAEPRATVPVVVAATMGR